MRAVSDGLLKAWRLGLVASHVRVQIGGIEMTDLQGFDWVESWRVQESVEQQVAVANVTLIRQFGELSLSTFLDGSKLNLGGAVVDVAKTLIIEVAVTSVDTTPTDDDFLQLFSGVIDDEDWSQNPITLVARDDGGEIEDALIEVQRVYPGVTGDDLEDVIQDVLDDNTGSLFTLFSENGTSGTPWNPADSPGFRIKKYKQSKQGTLEASSRLSNMIGWDLRYRFNDDTQDHELTLQEPDRAKTVAEFTFETADEYEDITQLRVSRLNVRNKVKVVYLDPGIAAYVDTGGETIDFLTTSIDIIRRSGGSSPSWITDGFSAEQQIRVIGSANNDGNYTIASLSTSELRLTTTPGTLTTETISGALVTINTGLRTVVTREDAASQAKYSPNAIPRVIELTEGASSQIDSIDEAVAMAEAALSDLAEPTASVGIEVGRLFPWVELGDLWAIAPNGVHFDVEQKFAPTGFIHTGKPGGGAITTAVLRGKVTGGAARWMEMEGGRAVASAQDTFQDAAGTVTTTPHLGTIILDYDDPRTRDPPMTDWAYTRVHLGTSAGFTPIPRELTPNNERGRARSTHFEIGGLDPGPPGFLTDYVVKAVDVDEQGNEAVTSADVVQAVERVGAFHSNHDGQLRNLIPNGNFGQATKDIVTIPPDGFVDVVGTWGTNLVENTTDNETGGRSIEIGPGQGTLRSDFVPVSVDQLYRFELRAKRSSGGDFDPALGVSAFDEAKSAVGGSFLNVFLGAVDTQFTTFSLYKYGRDFSAAARFVRVTGGANGTVGTMFLDLLTMVRAGHQFRVFNSVNQLVTANTVSVMIYNTVSYEEGDITIGGTKYGFDSASALFRCLIPGQYIIQASFMVDGMSASKFVEIGFRVNGVLPTIRGNQHTVGVTADQQIVVSAAIDMVKDDTVDVYCLHNKNPTAVISGGEINSYMHVMPADVGN